MFTSQAPLNSPRNYDGPERRGAPRIEVNYPIRVRFALPTGEKLERYSQLTNVSAAGLLFTCVDALKPGTEVDVSIGIPFVHAASLPMAQLNGEALVLRSESSVPDEEYTVSREVALKFLGTPTLSTELSMFD